MYIALFNVRKYIFLLVQHFFTKLKYNNQHVDFPSGHPPEYYPRLSLVDFAERTGCSPFKLIWPIILRPCLDCTNQRKNLLLQKIRFIKFPHSHNQINNRHQGLKGVAAFPQTHLLSSFLHDRLLYKRPHRLLRENHSRSNIAFLLRSTPIQTFS